MSSIAFQRRNDSSVRLPRAGIARMVLVGLALTLGPPIALAADGRAPRLLFI